MAVEKSLVFISHANPEDNSCAAWLATRLALLGYDAWCDIKNTRGGESDFWLKVQEKIETQAAKFIFLLSDDSCDFAKKKGIYKEVQAASNLKLDNFIVPLKIKKLSRPVPILLGTDLYIEAEDWACGLQQLVRRLEFDKVPHRAEARLQDAAQWWPPLQVETTVRAQRQEELVSNCCSILALPAEVTALQVFGDGNLIAGRDRLKGALNEPVAWSAFGDYALSFGRSVDFKKPYVGLDITDAHTFQTNALIREGASAVGLSPESAKNIVTYLVAEALEAFLKGKGLKSKTFTYTRRKLWFPADALIRKNRVSFDDCGPRKSNVQLVGSLKHFKKRYVWHFGAVPIIDLRNTGTITFSPRVVISAPYNGADGETPALQDDKKAHKALGWWNKEWRQKQMAFLAWLADGTNAIRIPAGSQELQVSAKPISFLAEETYLDIPDDAVMRQILQRTAA